MTSHRQKWIGEIAENPESNEARLVYADWLEERGDPQGEFIRVQIELTQDLTPQRRNLLESRQMQLMRAHAKTWGGRLRKWVKRWYYDRGLIAGILVDTESFLDHHLEITDYCPLSDLQLRGAFGFFKELASLPVWEQLESFGLPGCYLGNDGNPSARPGYDFSSAGYDAGRMQRAHEERTRARQAAQSQNAQQFQHLLDKVSFGRINSINLYNNLWGNVLVESLFRSDIAGQLQQLDIGFNSLSHEAIALLSFKGGFPKLKRLKASGCQNLMHSYVEEFTGPLCRELTSLINELESLDISRCGITWAGLAHLSDHYAESNLRDLNLHGSYLLEHLLGQHDEENQTKFLASTLLQNLKRLDLGSCYQTDGDFEAILASKLNLLEELYATNNDVTNNVGEMFQQAELSNLRVLHLDSAPDNWRLESSTGKADNAGLRDEGATRLFAAVGLRNLANLSLQRNKLTSESIPALLESPYLKQLYFLDLSDNRIGDEGLELLAQHGPWEQLATLNLRNNRLSSNWRQKLTRRFGAKIFV